jgi:large subunit ribosomal protein L23
MNEPYDLIQTVPVDREGFALGEKLNKYVFRVNPRANKIQIKHAIELLFKKKLWM